MGNLIYRFMSFPKFVDMIIQEKLTLVDPHLWDDPYEKEFFAEYLQYKSTDDGVRKNFNEHGFDLELILKFIISNNIFASSWTRQAESDALWRIYSDNNRAIRIAVEENELLKIDNCFLCDVKYRDRLSKEEMTTLRTYELFAIKRTEFEHEHEVRLISHLKFPSEEKELSEYLEAFFLIYAKDKRFIKDFQDDHDIDNIITSAVSLLNANGKEKLKKISVEPINEFITSVMLHPLAPNWIDEMMKEFCVKFKLNYLGKSELYLRK